MSSISLRRSAELGVPLVVIATTCLALRLPFYSIVPVVIISIFAVVQATLRYFLLDAVRDIFVASGRELHYWLTLGVLYAFVGLGVVQLFTLFVAPSP